jgi:hypothetical protein
MTYNHIRINGGTLFDVTGERGSPGKTRGKTSPKGLIELPQNSFEKKISSGILVPRADLPSNQDQIKSGIDG